MLLEKIVIFGGADWRRDTEYWDLGKAVGRILANAGVQVITGGYSGAMEAVSEGAIEAGGKTFGVLHSPVSLVPPNRFIQEYEIARDYLSRMAGLLRVKNAIALPGRSGTFAEIAIAFAMLQREEGRKLILFRPFWERITFPLIFENDGWDQPLEGLFWFDHPAELNELLSVPS